MKKIVIITSIIMIISVALALVKDKENNDYMLNTKMNIQIFNLETKIENVNKKIEEAHSIQNDNQENKAEKIGELKLWQNQVEKIKSY